MARNRNPMRGERTPGNGVTPSAPQRTAANTADSTKAASDVTVPHFPDIAHPVLTKHTRPPQVLGPQAIDNGRVPLVTKSGAPALRGARPADADPCR